VSVAAAGDPGVGGGDAGVAELLDGDHDRGPGIGHLVADIRSAERPFDRGWHRRPERFVEWPALLGLAGEHDQDGDRRDRSEGGETIPMR